MEPDFLVRYPGRAVTTRIRVRRGALDDLGTLVRQVPGVGRAAVVGDARVAALYGKRAVAALERSGIVATLIAVPPGEGAKQPRQLYRLWEHLAALGIRRADVVVALGGGVVGDLAGCAAATWLRGVRWVCVPTTVLAQVDSSIGGKTGVNLVAGKNLVGAFHQPTVVLADPELLATLPRRQVRAGLAEVAKMGMAQDASLFRWTEEHAARLAAGDLDLLENAVRRAVRAKARVVRRDEREREGGARAGLNYGHTLGHALEAARGYRGLLHGEAVAIGLRAAAWLSARVGGLSAADLARMEALLDALGLPRRMPPTPLAALLESMEHDKKRGSGSVRWVLTPRIGHASVPRPIARRLVRPVLIRLGARG